MREAVWIEIPLIIVLMIANMALLGTGNSLTDALAVVALALFVSFMLGSRPVIDRRPYGAAISVGLILLSVLAIAMVEQPRLQVLLLGGYAIVIVGSALLVTLNERSHRAWLALALIPLLVALVTASLSDQVRAQGLVVGLGAVATSVAGNSLVQRRRLRRWLQEEALRRQRRELREVVARLEAAAATIATLEGVLPICSHCKRIRDDDDTWVRVETYVEERSGAQFSHGICPECLAEHYGAFLSGAD